MIGFFGLPDFLPYFDLIDHNTALGFFLGAGGMQWSYRHWRARKKRKGGAA